MIRYILAALLALVALNAFAGGYYGMAGAEGVSTEWLRGTPFQDYFVPSLILFVAVGGSSLAAAIAVLRRSRLARWAAFGAAGVLFVWLVVQIAMIGYVSWMQPTFVAVALLLLLLTALLPRQD